MPHVLAPLRQLLRFTGRSFRDTFNELFPPIVPKAVREAELNGWHVDAPSVYCGRCGASTGPGEATARGCSHCINEPIAWDRIVRLGLYTEPLADWIVSMKFHKEWGWAVWLGERLAEAVMPITQPKSMVCHVPMPTLRRWSRGYSQAQLMATAFARRTGLPGAPILRRKGWQKPQTSVLRSQRHDNVKDASRIDAVDLGGWHVWLIDDVKNTGSSLTPCVRLLKKAGAESVCVAVAAVADPKNKDFKST